MPTSPSLEEHLGGAKAVIDQIVDGAPDGIEVLRGNSSYVYDGNWKLQMENGADGYHVSSVHWNYSATMGHRNYENEGTKTVDANGWSKSVGGVYGFENGHILLWTQPAQSRGPAGVRSQGGARSRGLARTAPASSSAQTRNLGIYPNVYLMDQFSTQIRVVRPIGVDRTEVTIYCFAPEGRGCEGAGDPHPAVRRFLQRLRNGHAGRSGGVPRMPDGLCRRRRALERSQPRCRRTGSTVRTRTPRRSG